MTTTTSLTFNGESLGILTPREQRIYEAGQAVGVAKLRRKVWNMRPPSDATRPYRSGYTDATDAVLDLIDGGK